MNVLKRIWGLVGGSSYTIKRASALLAITAILSSILGLVRNVIFAHMVSPGNLDIYYAGFRIPDFLFNIVIFSAASSALVPIISEYIAKERMKDAQRVTDQLLTWLTVIFVVIAIGLAVYMRQIVPYLAPKFVGTDRFEPTVWVSRLLLIQSIVFAWSFTLGAFLNSTKRFATYAIAPIVYNLTLIAGGIAAQLYGLTAIVYATVIGSLAHFLIQFLEARKAGYVPRLNFGFGKEVREITKLMIPRSISQGMTQLVLFAYTNLASGLLIGSISVFNLVNDLQTTPTVVIANSIAIAIFPTISAMVGEQNWDGINELLNKALRTVLFILLPSIALAFVLRAQIIRLYYASGHVSWELTLLAIKTLTAFLIGIIPASFVALLARLFYAMKNTFFPMVASIVAGAISIFFAWTAINYYHGSVVSLALADSLLGITQLALYLVVLSRNRKITLRYGEMLLAFVQYLFAAVVVAAASWLTLHAIDTIYNATDFLSTRLVIGLSLQLIVAGIVGILVFVAYSRAVHKEEFQWILGRRFTKNK
jgi:putative peptidoglycan lipid II flippase